MTVRLSGPDTGTSATAMPGKNELEDSAMATSTSPFVCMVTAGLNRYSCTPAMSKELETVGPAVVTSTSLTQERTMVSPFGVQPSAPPVHRTPFCQVADRKRSSPESIVCAPAGCPAAGGMVGWVH